jgi:myosin heavy subunit
MFSAEAKQRVKTIVDPNLLSQKHIHLEGVKQEDIECFHQIIDMLLAAGYFRVRIQSLTPFDKVIGGLCWCISNSNVDVDVDITFEEEANIGQKIAISEQIVSALTRMRSPHKVQAYQIQGLDFSELFKVLQWLVKKVFETREENRERIRKYSELVFSRRYELPTDVQAKEKYQEALPYLESVKGIYRPKRKYRIASKSKLNRWAHVQSVLLEYGREFTTMKETDSDRKKRDQLKSELEKQLGSSGTKSNQVPDDVFVDEEIHKKRIAELKRAMTDENASENQNISRLNVNKLLSLGSQDIEEEIAKNEERSKELLEQQQAYGQSDEMMHKRNKTQLEKQIQKQKDEFQTLKKDHTELSTKLSTMQEELHNYKTFTEKVEAKLQAIHEKLSQNEGDLEALAKLQELVMLNESLKKQEEEFRANCKKQHAELKEILSKLETEANGGVDEKLMRAIEADQEKMKKIKQLASKRNMEIAILQRKVDEIPTSLEQSQYERRFTELYGQINSKLEETRKYFDIFNTLSETAKYLEKETSLLNSISEYFQKSLTSKNKQYKTWMVENVEKIVQTVEKTKEYVDKKTKDEKAKQAVVGKRHQELVSQQRSYFRNLKDFQDEVKKHEEIQRRLAQR